MSYTNKEIVKSFLVESLPLFARVVNQPVTLIDDDYVSFFNRSIESSSVIVKNLKSNVYTRSSLTLNASTVNFSSIQVVPESVVVSNNSSLGIIYIENSDFIIDYQNGNLTIKSNSRLQLNQPVTIWYQTFHIYTNTSDYQIDSVNGKIKKVPSGSIAAGETVYLDYTPLSATYNEELIENSVFTANGLIEKEVDPEASFGADLTLQTAATFKALEIICHASVLRELSSNSFADKKSSDWIKLGEIYRQKSEELIKKFRPPFSPAKSPTHS